MSRRPRHGRRAAKGREAAAAPVPARAETRPPAPAPRDERPRAPWHPVPLAELCVLLGIVLIVWGLFASGDRGRVLLVTGLALGSLGGLDTAAREHFAGFRSHTLVLAGVPAVGIAVVLSVAHAPWIVVPISFALVFAAAAVALRRAWRS